MDTDDTELHAETDAARAGSTPNIVRWILVVSLLAAIVLLSIIWITGAATQEDAEEHVEVTSRAADANDTAGTDSIVDDGFDEIEAAEPGEESGAMQERTVENKQEAQE